MIPSPRWFPTSLAERLVWMLNFAKQFGIYAVGLGFTAADVTAIQDLNEDFQSIGIIADECPAHRSAPFVTVRAVKYCFQSRPMNV